MEKKSFKYLLISVCLALLIASIGGVIVGASSVKDDTLAIKAETLDVNGAVGIAFAVPESVYTANPGIRLEVYDADPTKAGANKLCTVTETWKNDEGEDVKVNGCVVFITDGIVPYDFANDVYARLETDSAYGATRKTGVLELAYKMLDSLNGLDSLSAAQTTRKNLYTSLISYHDYVQQVFNPNYKPVTYVKVEDGIINGGGASALVKEGDVIDVVSTFDASSVGMAFIGWSSDGTAANLQGNKFAISNVTPGTIQTIDAEPMFAEVTSDAWLNSGKTQKTVNSIWNNTGIITNSSSKDSSYYADDEGNATKVYNYRYISQLLDEDGLYLSVDHNKTFGGATGAERFALPQTLAPNSSTIMSFDIRIAERDYNGNGYGIDDNYTELNANADGANTATGNFKFNVGIATDAAGYSVHSTTVSGATNDLVDIGLFTNSTRFPNFAINTTTRNSANANDKFGSTTKEGVATGVWHNIQVEYITNDTYVSGLKVYLDGELIATRAMGDATYPLSHYNNVADTAFPIANVGAVCFSMADSSTYKGTIDVRNIVSYSKTDAKGATAVKADAAYTASPLYVGTFNSASASVNLQKWNTLQNGVVGYGSNDLTEKPIIYNSTTNEVLQYAPYSATNKANGQTFYLFENPLYNKSAAELANKTLTYSFKMTTAFINCDGDTTWQENADNGVSGSSMISYMFFGFVDGNIAKANKEAVMDRFTRLGVTTSGENYGFALRSSDVSPDGYTNGTTCQVIKKNLAGGVYTDISVAVKFNADGAMSSVTFTVTDSTGASASHTMNDSAKGTDSFLDDFTAVDATAKQYFGMQSNLRNGRANTIRYAGFSYSFN